MALVRDGAGVSKIQGMVDDKVLFSVVSSLRVRNMDYFFPAPCASSSYKRDRDGRFSFIACRKPEKIALPFVRGWLFVCYGPVSRCGLL
jgi:hypothetical protein